MAGRQVLSAAVKRGKTKLLPPPTTVEPSVFDEVSTGVRISETEKSAKTRRAKTIKLDWSAVKLFHPLPESIHSKSATSRWKFPLGNLPQLSFQSALQIWPTVRTSPSDGTSSRKKKKAGESTTTTKPTPAENRARLLSMSLDEVEKSLVTLCEEMATEFVVQLKKPPSKTFDYSSQPSDEEAVATTEWVAKNLSACTSFPWEDIAGSPFSLRLQALAVESGLYAVNQELRGYPTEKSLADVGSKSARGLLLGTSPLITSSSSSTSSTLGRKEESALDFSKPKWKRGHLTLPSFEMHRRGRERPLMVMHPQLMGKQASLEAVAALSGPFWHSNITNWELYMATRAARTLEACTFYFIDDVLRTRDPSLLSWFKGTPLGFLYAEEGRRIVQERGGTTRFPPRDFFLEGQSSGRDSGADGVAIEKIDFAQPSGVFPRWAEVGTLRKGEWVKSDWLQLQAKLLQDGVRVFDREIRALREQIALHEPFPSLYHPECPNLAVSEEAFDFLIHHSNRFVGNPLYSLAINHAIPRPPPSSSHSSPNIPCSTITEYLDHLEALVDRLLFQPIHVKSDQFLARAKARTLADYLAQISLVPLPVSDSESPALLKRLHEDAGEEIKRAFEDPGFVIDLKKWRLAIPNMTTSHQVRLAFATGGRKFVDQGWDSWTDLSQLVDGLKASLPITTHVLSALLWTPGVHRFPEFLEGIVNSEVLAWSRKPLSQRITNILSQLKLVVSEPPSTTPSSSSSEIDSVGLRQVLVDLANFEQFYRETSVTNDEFTPLLRELGSLINLKTKRKRRSRSAVAVDGEGEEKGEGEVEGEVEGEEQERKEERERLVELLKECSLALNPVFQVRWFASDALTLFSAVEAEWLKTSRLSKTFTLKEQQAILKVVHLINSTRPLTNDEKKKISSKGKKVVESQHQQQHHGFHLLFGSGTVLPVPDFLATKWPSDRNQPLKWHSFGEMKDLLQPPASEELKALLLDTEDESSFSPPASLEKKTKGKSSSKSEKKKKTTTPEVASDSVLLSEALEDTDLWWLNLIDTGAVLVVRKKES